MFVRLRHSRPVGLARYYLYRDILLAFPRRISCNICGWRGRRLLRYHDPHVLCPRCGSKVRHRLIAAALQRRPAGIDVTPLHGRVLHVSPEYCLDLVLRPRARQYIRADRGAMDCDLRQDATRMAFQDGLFDAIVMCDTLEHVVDDRAALQECRRIIRPGGLAIVTVPQNEQALETFEDPSITAEADRVLHFGQHDHVRNYGLDFGDRLAAHGFDATCVDASDFDAATVAAHVLQPPVSCRSAFGWTNRRIYFARRT